MIKLLLVFENRVYGQAVGQALTRQERFHVVGCATGAPEALDRLQQSQVDLVIIGTPITEGRAAVHALRLAGEAPVVVVGAAGDDEEALAWAEAGAAGYVPRDATLEDLTSTLDAAIRGEFHCSASLAASMLRRLQTLSKPGSPAPREPPLTLREREIVVLIDQGCSNKDIARRLGIEVATVKNHVHNILEKLRVHGRGEAAAWVGGRRQRSS